MSRRGDAGNSYPQLQCLPAIKRWWCFSMRVISQGLRV
jgi:hypothetical protein